MNEKYTIIAGIIAVIAICIVGAIGIIINNNRPGQLRSLDQRYYSEYGRAAETIEQLERELRQERQLNQQLREHNNRARELNGEVAAASRRNVRNLQDAIGLIGEIRAKLQVLAKFYSDSDSSLCGAGGLDGL